MAAAASAAANETPLLRFSKPILGSEAVVPTSEWRTLESGENVLLLRGMLSKGECKAVMDASADMGMVPASSSISARNCDRLLAEDAPLATALWDRCKSEIGKSEAFRKVLVHEADEKDFGALSAGLWNPSRLNPRFRSCKYAAGGHFAPHADGIVVMDDTNERSFLTFMIYLDDVADERAGATRFFRTPTTAMPDDPLLVLDDSGRMTGSPSHVELKVQPEAGLAIVFKQATVLHDGEPVLTGTKSILRSDVVYSRVRGTGAEPTADQFEGLKLHKQAVDAEIAKDFKSAMKLYSKAFRLYPELESIGGPV
jgi:hypothetical protein